MGRNDLCFCGSGKKTKKCHPDINEASVVASLLRKFYDFDCMVAHESNHINAPCNKGCSACCHDYFYISGVEYYCIVNYILANGIGTKEMLKKAEAIKAEIRVEYPEEYDLLQKPVQNHKSKNLFAEGQLSDQRISHLKNGCPFLGEAKDCLIYPVRPFICRGYGVLTQFGGCQKCCNRSLLNINIPCELLVDNVDTYRLKNFDRVVLPRPYPIAEWVSYFGLDPSPRYTAAIAEPIEHYIKLF